MTGSGVLAEFAVARDDFVVEVALDLSAGQTTAILGPNGAGKSTVVAALSGLIPIDRGRISISGNVVDDPADGRFVAAEARKVGVVFQDGLLFPHMSVEKNIAFGPASKGDPDDSEVSRWIDLLGLTGVAHRRPGEISGGEAQRVALARALINDPDLLLLDEPLSALDVTAKVETRRLLRRHLDAFRGPRVLITHDPQEAFLLADRIHVLEAGRITQSGTAGEIQMRPRTSYAADLAGINLLSGTAAGGRASIDEVALRIADSEVEGEVLMTVRPQAIALHLDRPGGSPRNIWETTIVELEESNDRFRVGLGKPLPLTAEVTSQARRNLGLSVGDQVWVSIKATEIGVEPR